MILTENVDYEVKITSTRYGFPLYILLVRETLQAIVIALSCLQRKMVCPYCWRHNRLWLQDIEINLELV